ncbi:MAG TPA: YceI family protein [Candidatus Kapabacteria bacterium]|nr:YceI family protein [Candidatus Kapabacteria bacterium]
MKITHVVTIAATAAALLVTSASVQAQGLAVAASGQKTVKLSDKVSKNQFNWLSSAPGETINGTAEGIAGSFTFDPKKPASLRGTVSCQVATMKTGNETRDGHLKSSTWLDAAQYPTISFTITSVSDVKVNRNQMTGKAVGTFTMHGVTKPMTIPFSLQYIDASAQTRERAPGDLVMVTADFTVSLKDFNVAGRQGLIGSKVGETIKISAKLFGSTGL